MKSIILTTCLFILSISLFAQTIAGVNPVQDPAPVEATATKVTGTMVAVHNKAAFTQIGVYLAEHLTYPAEMTELAFEGTVTAAVIISTTGEIARIIIVKADLPKAFHLEVMTTLEEVRTISRDLHPVLLEKFGITATIKDTVERIAATAPELFISSEIDEVDGILTPKTEVQIFRTVQEALSNVVKHAEASATKVTVRKHTDRIEVIVQDNGKSFDHELAVARSKSMGLRTMFERITSAGGKFAIKSKAGSGTKITATVPTRNVR